MYRGVLLCLCALVACRDRASAPVDAAASASAASAAPAISAPEPPSASVDPPPPPPTIASTSSTLPPPRPADSSAVPSKQMYRKAKVDNAQLAKIFAGIPELARVSADPQLFDPNEGAYLVRSEAPHAGISFTTTPLLYTPEQGMEMLVVTGHSKSTSFIVALWTLPNDEYRLASSFLMLHDNLPVALAYSEKGKRLWWTSCWNCPGEQGHLRITDDRRVVIVQQ